MKRVKFFSANDLSIAMYLNRIEEIITTFDTYKHTTDINDIIELYNTRLFFRNHIYSRDWTSQQVEKYVQTVEEFSKTIGIFFSKLFSSQIVEVFEATDSVYLEDFWCLLEGYKVYKQLDKLSFCMLLQSERFLLSHVLSCKQLVNAFSNEIVQYMEQNPNCAEILLGYYLEKHQKTEKPLYLPGGLSNDKRVAIIDKYIESDTANTNYIKLIFKSNGTKELPLSDRLKLKASRKYNEQIEQLFKDQTGFSIGAKIGFSEEQDEAWIYDKGNDGILSVTYSVKWIKENLDYPTLLNNFIYVFHYTDMRFRSRHVRTESQMGVFEKLIGLMGKREYHVGVVFHQIQMLAQLQMISYCRQLERYNIRLEEIIQWFFKEYLSNEFNAVGYCYHVSSESASFLEKCRNIAPEMDSILKQFRLWCEDGEIDPELLQVNTEHMFIQNIPSMLEDKYVYPYGENYRHITNLLFSDQSLLCFMPEYEHNYNSFYKLLQQQVVGYDMLQEYQKPSVDWLISQDIIKLDKEKRIILNHTKVEILRDLYENDVLCRYYAQRFEDVIEELKAQGLVEFESSLFSRPEQDYFNYLFNKSVFDNGLDIRNRYSHGTQSGDDHQNEQDYYVFLRMMILIIIKINEEFCLKDSIEKKGSP